MWLLLTNQSALFQSNTSHKFVNDKESSLLRRIQTRSPLTDVNAIIFFSINFVIVTVTFVVVISFIVVLAVITTTMVVVGNDVVVVVVWIFLSNILFQRIFLDVHAIYIRINIWNPGLKSLSSTATGHHCELTTTASTNSSSNCKQTFFTIRLTSCLTYCIVKLGYILLCFLQLVK